MAFAFATLLFLTTLWVVGLIGAQMLDDSGGKILAALRGASTEPMVRTAAVRLRHAPRARRALRATPRWRAAA